MFWLMRRLPHKKIMERDSIRDYKTVDEVLEKVNTKDFKKRIFITLS